MRNIPAEFRVPQTGEATGFDQAFSSFGRNGPADCTIDCVTDVRRDGGLWSDWHHSHMVCEFTRGGILL